MKNRHIGCAAYVIVLALLISSAEAQSDFRWLEDGSGPSADAQKAAPLPLSLNETGDETEESGEAQSTEQVEDETDEGGFWMFPKPAPLTGRIATDRPGFSDNAGLVPRGRNQFEMGYTFTYDREDDDRLISHTFPELLYRTGLTDYLELRIAWTGGTLIETLTEITTPAGRRVSKEDHSDGYRDMSLGAKVPILRGQQNLPNVSAIYTMSMPTGNSTHSTNDVSYELKFPWNYPLADRLTIYGSALGRVLNSPDGHFYQTAVTTAAGYRVMDDLTLYLEYFGVYPFTKESDCAHILSAGPIIHLADNVSLDLRAGLGLNEEAPDFQASIGFGFRF